MNIRARDNIGEDVVEGGGVWALGNVSGIGVEFEKHRMCRWKRRSR